MHVFTGRINHLECWENTRKVEILNEFSHKNLTDIFTGKDI